MSANKLFCVACCEEVALKISIIRCHIVSSKHASGKDRLKLREAMERGFAMSLETYDTEVHARGETLPKDHRVYQIKALMAFLRAGVPLNKIEHFRPLLEEHAYSLGGRRAMSDLITLVLQNEKTQLKKEIEGREVSVIFDGTMHVGEAMAVVLRFVDSQWKIQQQLVRLMLLAKSMTGEKLARELIVVLSTGLGIGPNKLKSAMRDRAAVNVAAMRTVKVLYPNILDVGSFSHTLTMLVVISPHLSLMSLSEAGWPSLPTVQKHDYSERLVLGVLCVVTAVQGGGANGKLWNNFLSHLGMLRDFLITMETLGWQPEQSC